MQQAYKTPHEELREQIATLDQQLFTLRVELNRYNAILEDWGRSCLKITDLSVIPTMGKQLAEARAIRDTYLDVFTAKTKEHDRLEETLRNLGLEVDAITRRFRQLSAARVELQQFLKTAGSDAIRMNTERGQADLLAANQQLAEINRELADPRFAWLQAIDKEKHAATKER